MDKKTAYLVTFFNNISFCTNSIINIEDEEFQKMVFGFICNYYNTNKKIMDKVFDIKIENNQAIVKINFEDVVKYGSMFQNRPQEFVKMYNDIGDKTIDEIMKLALLFCQYVDKINDLVSHTKVRI